MLNDNKRSIIVAVVIIAVLCILTFSILYFIKQDDYNKPFVNDKKKLSIVISGSDVYVLNNSLPMTDELGKKADIESISDEVINYSEIIIKNSSKEKQHFDIYVTRVDEVEDEIGFNYVKFYLTDDKDVPLGDSTNGKLPTFYSMKYLSDMPSNKKVYGDYIESGETKKFRLRVWVSDSYGASRKKEEFKYKLGVRNK